MQSEATATYPAIPLAQLVFIQRHGGNLLHRSDQAMENADAGPLHSNPTARYSLVSHVDRFRFGHHLAGRAFRRICAQRMEALMARAVP